MAPGCAAQGTLVAADGSRRMVAQDPGQGLTMVITTGVWSGDPAVDDYFTPIHVLIDNRGTKPVLIAPGDFEMRDRRGFLYRLQDAGGTFRRVDPAPSNQQNYIGAAEYDPGARRNYERIHTDDPDVARLALPWGVLDPGTQVRGYLYFQPVTATANHAQLRWYAQGPDHQAISTLGFDLHTARLRGRKLQPKPKQSRPPGT